MPRPPARKKWRREMPSQYGFALFRATVSIAPLRVARQTRSFHSSITITVRPGLLVPWREISPGSVEETASGDKDPQTLIERGATSFPEIATRKEMRSWPETVAGNPALVLVDKFFRVQQGPEDILPGLPAI